MWTYCFISFVELIICLNSSLAEAETNDDHEIESAETLQFDFDAIKLATNNFSIANKLGQGGFGPVYKVR